MSGLWAVNVGYGREEIAKAAYEQMKKLPYVPMTQSHKPAIWNSLKKSMSCSVMTIRSFIPTAGRTRTKWRLKWRGNTISKMASHRAINSSLATAPTTAALWGRWRQPGRPYGNTNMNRLHQGFYMWLHRIITAALKAMSVEAYNIQRAQELKRKSFGSRKETIAAVIMEPLITGGGILIPHPVYVEKVQEICKRHGVLLIIDEVICGFGRTGKASASPALQH